MQASDLQPKWEFVSKDPAVQYIMPMIAHHKPLLHRENWEMDFRASQTNIYISFLDTHLFLQQPGNKKLLGHWITALLQENTIKPTLSLAAHGLAASFFGSVHQRPDIVAHGAQLYGLALRSFFYNTMACANALELYEVILLNSFIIWGPQ